MRSKRKIIIIILILLLIGLISAGVIMFSSYNQGKSNFQGQHNILLLCADPGEQREGVGGVDMVYLIELNDGKLGETTPIYPGGLYDPSLNPPADLRSYGVDQWYLHDALWTSDLEEGTKRAQQIVEYNFNYTSDIVVVVTPEAIDAVIKAVGPVYANGQEVTIDSLTFLRTDQDNGATRGDAVEGLADGIINATKTNGKYWELFTTILDQYSKGNILCVPNDAFQKLVTYVGVKNIIS